MGKKLTAKDRFIGDEMLNMMHFQGDEIAMEIGIPSRVERDWTDEEIDLVWAEIERRFGNPFLAPKD